MPVDLKSITGVIDHAKSASSGLIGNLTTVLGIIGLSSGAVSKLLGVQESALKNIEKRKKMIATVDLNVQASTIRYQKVVSDHARLMQRVEDATIANDQKALNKATKKLQMAAQERTALESSIDLLREQADEILNVEKAATKNVRTILLGAAYYAAFTEVKHAIQANLEYNKTLLGANSTLEERTRLWRKAIEVQIAVGASTREIAETTEQLRQNGLLYYQSTDQGLASLSAAASRYSSTLGDPAASTELKRSLETIEMIRHGLGMGVAEAAKLANQARILGTSFDAVANSLATIQNRTTLTAQQLGSLSEVVYDTMRGIGREGSFDKALRDAAALEDSLKKVGASAGAASELIRSFSEMGAKGGMAMAMGGVPGMGLGASNDEMMAFVERVGRRLEGPMEAMRRNPGNWQAILQFEALAKQFGLTRRSAVELTQASKFLREAQADLGGNSKTLAERFREQSASTGEVWGQLLQSLKGLMEYGLRPLTITVAHLNDQVSKLRGWYKGQSDLVKGIVSWTAAAISFSGVALLAGTAIWNLKKGLMAVIGVVKLILGIHKPVSLTGAAVAGAGQVAARTAGTAVAGAAGEVAASAATSAATTTLIGKLSAWWQRGALKPTYGPFKPPSELPIERWIGSLSKMLGDLAKTIAKWWSSLSISAVIAALREFGRSLLHVRTWFGFAVNSLSAIVRVVGPLGLIAAGLWKIAEFFKEIYGMASDAEKERAAEFKRWAKPNIQTSVAKVADKNREALFDRNKTADQQLETVRLMLSKQSAELIRQAGSNNAEARFSGRKIEEIFDKAAEAFNDRIKQQAVVVSLDAHSEQYTSAEVIARQNNERYLSQMLEALRDLKRQQQEAIKSADKQYVEALKRQAAENEKAKLEAFSRATETNTSTNRAVNPLMPMQGARLVW